MTIKLPSNVVAFAAGDTSLFESFKDYWNQYQSENGGKKVAFSTDVSFAEKEDRLNKALIREIGKRSGVDLTNMAMEQAITHPLVGWALGNLASQLIDAVLPDTIIDSTAAYAEVRTLGYGETALFNINSRDLFPVSRAGRLGMREAEMHKGYEGQVVLNPEMREITASVSLFRVLTGQESLSRFTVKCLRSIETAMTQDIYTVFNDAMAALDSTANTGLRVSGYTALDLTKLAQRVSAFSGGAQPILLGTKVALASVLPDDSNYRYDLIDSPFVTLGHVRVINGVSIFELPQVANWNAPFRTYLSDSRLYIIAPGTDKLVKVVLGGAMVSNVTNSFDSSLLLQNATMFKAWKAGIVTSSLGATIDL